MGAEKMLRKELGRHAGRRQVGWASTGRSTRGAHLMEAVPTEQARRGLGWKGRRLRGSCDAGGVESSGGVESLVLRCWG